MMEIDQSGKVEEITKNTVLCVSNGKWKVVVIRTKDKRKLKDYFNRWNMPRNYIYFVFCAGIAELLKLISKNEIVIIDEEYTGKESIIKNILIEMLGDKLPQIRFGRIGKKSMAHHRAHGVATQKIRRSSNVIMISSEEILRQIKKTKAFKKLSNA